MLKQTSNSFKTNFQLSEKLRNQLRQFFGLFCHLIPLILGQNSVKGLKVIKNLKEISFVGTWDELKLNNKFQRQQITKYLN